MLPLYPGSCGQVVLSLGQAWGSPDLGLGEKTYGEIGDMGLQGELLLLSRKTDDRCVTPVLSGKEPECYY